MIYRLALIGLAMMLGTPTAYSQTVMADIAYGSKERNTLDLYMPGGIENPPLVMFIHGGRWFRNDKGQVHLYNRIEHLMKAGIAVASINYTYSMQDVWPAQLEDVKTAMAFLHKNNETYGYDSSRMAVWGQSSGAHLAVWAGLEGGEAPEINVDAVVAWYAPSDLYHLEADRAADDVPDKNVGAGRMSPESKLIGKQVKNHKDDADAASPVLHISRLPKEKLLPNFLLMHGTADFIVSPLQTKRLYETISLQGGAKNVQLQMVEGGEHGGDKFGPVVPDVIKFLTKELQVKMQ